MIPSIIYSQDGTGPARLSALWRRSGTKLNDMLSSETLPTTWIQEITSLPPEKSRAAF